MARNLVVLLDSFNQRVRKNFHVKLWSYKTRWASLFSNADLRQLFNNYWKLSFLQWKTWIVSAAQKKRNVVAFSESVQANMRYVYCWYTPPIRSKLKYSLVISSFSRAIRFFLCLPDCTTENHNQSELMWKKSIVQRFVCNLLFLLLTFTFAGVDTGRKNTPVEQVFTHQQVPTRLWQAVIVTRQTRHRKNQSWKNIKFIEFIIFNLTVWRFWMSKKRPTPELWVVIKWPSKNVFIFSWNLDHIIGKCEFRQFEVYFTNDFTPR